MSCHLIFGVHLYEWAVFKIPMLTVIDQLLKTKIKSIFYAWWLSFRFKSGAIERFNKLKKSFTDASPTYISINCLNK